VRQYRPEGSPQQTNTTSMNNASKTPPPPEKPDPNECCGGGCVPCVYDYYYEQLAKWEKQYKPSDNKDDKRS